MGPIARRGAGRRRRRQERGGVGEIPHFAGAIGVEHRTDGGRMTRISIPVALLMLSASAMAQQSPTSGTMPPPDLSFVPEHLHQIPDFGKPRGTRALSEPALRHQIEAIE